MSKMDELRYTKKFFSLFVSEVVAVNDKKQGISKTPYSKKGTVKFYDLQSLERNTYNIESRTDGKIYFKDGRGNTHLISDFIKL